MVTSAATKQETDALADVHRRYVFRAAREVENYLHEHPPLVQLLVEARDKIADHFGRSAQVDLEVFVDPEAPDERQLYALIQTALPSDAALRSLHDFDEGWWMKAVPRAEGGLVISFEHI